MPTIPVRTSFQCARSGWRPRPLSRKRLAHKIAQSIHQARQRGETRPIALYTSPFKVQPNCFFDS